MKVFERIFFVRLLLACLLVVPSTILYQKSLANDAKTAALKKASAQIAQETVNRSLAECTGFNETRTGIIDTAKAMVRASEQTPLSALSPADRLMFAQFLAREHRAIEGVTHAKVCTIESLGLQDLAKVAANP